MFLACTFFCSVLMVFVFNCGHQKNNLQCLARFSVSLKTICITCPVSMDRASPFLVVSITSMNWRGQLCVKAMNWNRQSAKVFARMKLKSAQRRMGLLYQNKLMPEERGEAGLLCNDKCWFPPRYLKWFDPVILLNHRQEMINVLLMRPLHFISHSPSCRIAQALRGACYAFTCF